jgi:hypothetical protein
MKKKIYLGKPRNRRMGEYRTEKEIILQTAHTGGSSLVTNFASSTFLSYTSLNQK